MYRHRRRPIGAANSIVRAGHRGADFIAGYPKSTIAPGPLVCRIDQAHAMTIPSAVGCSRKSSLSISVYTPGASPA